MQDFFDVPPEGAIPTQAPKIELRSVQWKPRNVQADWVAAITNELFHSWLPCGKVGVTTYDREQKVTVPLQKLSFVVLDVAIGCDGTVWGIDNRPEARYYSNRIFDTRTQRLAVWMEGAGKNPVFAGLYKDIKDKLPKGVSYSKYLVVYCLELDAMVEVSLNKQVEISIKKCLAKIDNDKGKKTKWESVNIFNIATNDHLWGFSFGGYAKVNKEGEEYDGQGDMFFAPILKGGIVNPAKPENADLHGKCVDMQAEYRAFINGKIERGARYNEQQGQSNDKQDNSARNATIDLGGEVRQYQQQPDNSGFHGPASVKARQEPTFDAFPIPFPTSEPVPAIDGNYDDLPF